MTVLEKLVELDKELFLKINSLNSPFLDGVMYQISGNLIWLPLYLFLVYFLVKNYRNWPLLLVGTAVAVGLADYISVHAFKEVFMRLRPCHNPEIQDMVHLVKNHCGGKYGFVSSHAANTFALATYLSLIFRKKYMTVILFVYAAVVAYSRVYLGVHYPGDVTGGALLGMLLGYLTYLTVKKIEEKWIKSE